MGAMNTKQLSDTGFFITGGGDEPCFIAHTDDSGFDMDCCTSDRDEAHQMLREFLVYRDSAYEALRS